MSKLRRAGFVIALVAAMLSYLVTPVQAAVVPLRIMIVGDSITQGSSGDVTWRYRLYQHLRGSGVSFDFVGDRSDLYNNVTNTQGDYSYPYAFDRDHHAKWGQGLAYEVDSIGTAVTSTQAQVVLVLLGINDLLWLNHSPATVAEDMQRFVTNARAANPSVTIVIGHTMSRYDFWNKLYLDREATADLNQRYDALAASMSTSGSRVITTPDPTGWDPAVHTWDGTHPNTTGETRIAAAFATALSRVGIGGTYTGPLSGTWPWSGQNLTTTSLDRAARLDWSRTPGATGYMVEQKVVKPLGETSFGRLPYPIGDTTWTTSGQAGWEIDYRIVPVKGLMAGTAGASARAVFGGNVPGKVTLSGAPGNDENTQHLSWTSTPDATGYYIETKDLSTAPDSWSRLPWPVSGTSFDPGLLYAGRWYRWRVVPVNGLLEGPASDPIDIRTKGVPAYSRFYALGDSYSAGTGNQDSFGTTCLRSPNSWPSLAKAPWDPSPNLIACAGATTTDVRNYQMGQIPWHSQSGPTLITLTIGGNDVGFGAKLYGCATDSIDCNDSLEVETNAEIDAMYEPLKDLYRDIRSRAPGADIYVSGYPQLLAPYSPCPTVINSRLSDGKRLMIKRLGERLNGVIHTAAIAAGVFVFTDNVTSRFGEAHAACGSDPWINDVVFSYVESSFHPFEPGNFAYAYALNDKRVLVNQNGAVRTPV